MTDASPDPTAASPDRTPSLARCVHETEAHVAADGWDGPARVFALVDSHRALAADPSLAGVFPESPDPYQLVAVEQEGLPAADTLEELLAQLGWPETVDGVALTVERVVLPPEAEAELEAHLSDPIEPDEAHAPDGEPATGDRLASGAARQQAADREAALAALAAHPKAQDVRLAVGVLRTGESWCAVRTRAHDTDQDVAGSPDAVPGLVEALAATLG